MKTKIHLLVVLLLSLSFFCKDNKKNLTENKAVVYVGGDIITMADNDPKYAEALVVNNGKIQFIGASDKVMEIAGSGHRMVNLERTTLLPSFIDPHSHFKSALSMSSQANCSPSPVGKVHNVEGIVKALRDLKKEKQCLKNNYCQQRPEFIMVLYHTKIKALING